MLFIEAAHHVICQPDLPTTTDTLEWMSGAMGHNNVSHIYILYTSDKTLENVTDLQNLHVFIVPGMGKTHMSGFGTGRN